MSSAPGDPMLLIPNPVTRRATSDASATAITHRSWLAQVMFDTVGRTGARLGLAWICVVASCAIFAPLLANSFPLLAKVDGHWQFPAFQFLTPVDVSLLAIVPLALIVAFVFRRFSFRRKVAVFFSVLLMIGVVSAITVRPPMASGYEDFRDLQKHGRVQWALYAPVRFSPQDHLNDQFDIDHQFPWEPSRGHWLGTDQNGEDVLAVMIHAGRIAMSIGFIATGISLIIGIIVGAFMGYFSGIVDLIGMRLVEVFGSIPQIYLLLAFCAVFERNIYIVMAIIGFTSWTGDARFVRAEFLRLRDQDFVHAARAAGLPLSSVLFRHLLPNALAPLLVSASFGIASAILSEAVLSFLGLGLPVDAASWGRLLNEAVSGSGGFYWWLATFPGMAIFLTVFAYNLIGEALRDALDPKLQASR